MGGDHGGVAQVIGGQFFPPSMPLPPRAEPHAAVDDRIPDSVPPPPELSPRLTPSPCDEAPAHHPAGLVFGTEAAALAAQLHLGESPLGRRWPATPKHGAQAASLSAHTPAKASRQGVLAGRDVPQRMVLESKSGAQLPWAWTLQMSLDTPERCPSEMQTPVRLSVGGGGRHGRRSSIVTGRPAALSLASGGEGDLTLDLAACFAGPGASEHTGELAACLAGPASPAPCTAARSSLPARLPATAEGHVRPAPLPWGNLPLQLTLKRDSALPWAWQRPLVLDSPDSPDSTPSGSSHQFIGGEEAPFGAASPMPKLDLRSVYAQLTPSGTPSRRLSGGSSLVAAQPPGGIRRNSHPAAEPGDVEGPGASAIEPRRRRATRPKSAPLWREDGGSERLANLEAMDVPKKGDHGPTIPWAWTLPVRLASAVASPATSAATPSSAEFRTPGVPTPAASVEDDDMQLATPASAASAAPPPFGTPTQHEDPGAPRLQRALDWALDEAAEDAGSPRGAAAQLLACARPAACARLAPGLCQSCARSLAPSRHRASCP